MPDSLPSDIRAALDAKDFSLARRLLEEFVRTPGLRPELLTKGRQKLALATYKDKEVQSEAALEKALLALRSEGLSKTSDPETLGLAGAVHKRLWEINGNVGELAQALRYYERARDAGESGKDIDKWAWGSVNVAFLCDLLADQANDGEESSPQVEAQRGKADEERQRVCDRQGEILAVTDPDHAWWVRASLIEAYFGLGKFPETRKLLEKSMAQFKPDPWQLETMARQLAAIARLRLGSDNLGAAFEALEPVVSGLAAQSFLIGKVGLALSGGGFRAALFHVGVLARLAELDLLRHVEVLSCVSGGSILGALYYLQLRQLLQSATEDNIGRECYLKVVEAVQDKLLEALRRDIRSSAMLKSLWSLASQRTIITGQMIDAALYADLSPSRRLADLKITPLGPDGPQENFHPRNDNWTRAAKAPVLILNATSLNTGHNWQFTASFMGEAPTCIEPAVDATERYRRMYYKQAPQPHGDALLATAVASSAAVPGVFRPIKLKGLYPDRVVRLSDGGVHDNQGIFGLMEQDCNVMVVSDGCGQLRTEGKPSWLFSRVLTRANSILMDAVRRNSYRILDMRLRSKRVRSLDFIHLKMGLPTKDITWSHGPPSQRPAVPSELIRSGLDEQTQRALAAIRTDLDCFSENECHALMFAGYRIADRSFERSSIPGLKLEMRSDRWKFLRVAKWMDENTAATAPPGFVEELECGRHLFLRRIRLSPIGRALAKLAG